MSARPPSLWLMQSIEWNRHNSRKPIYRGRCMADTKTGESRFRSTVRALRHRNFRLFFAGQLISLIGTWMQTVAQSWLVYRLTGSSALLGSVNFASQIPVFLLSPVGG